VQGLNGSLCAGRYMKRRTKLGLLRAWGIALLVADLFFVAYVVLAVLAR